MQKRTLGKTGEELSVIGCGGIVVMDTTPKEAGQYIGEVIDLGINYFDVAPTYGNAEERLGPALKPYRDQVFLACKTEKRDAPSARAALENSLKTLQTDHFDLYQFHAVGSLEDVHQLTAPGGALEMAIRAREQGLIRNIGFSAHSEDAALALLDAFPFDSILFPVNFACWNDGDFGPTLLAKADALGIGILAIKALAKRRLLDDEPRPWAKCWYAPIDTPAEAAAALAFTLSKPITAALPPGHIELLRLACAALETQGTPAWTAAPQADAAPLFPVKK